MLVDFEISQHLFSSSGTEGMTPHNAKGQQLASGEGLLLAVV
jgi:hypothetical protein